MNNSTIEIPLSKNGKHAGKYAAIVDTVDSEFAQLNWQVLIDKYTQYAYRTVRENGKYKCAEYLHRVIMERIQPIPDGMQIDHIDGNGLNNRRENLRLATRNQNQHNQGKYANNTSGYKGVTWFKRTKKWRARININGKNTYLGLFDTPEAAYAAYCEAAEKLHGEFANYGEE